MTNEQRIRVGGCNVRLARAIKHRAGSLPNVHGIGTAVGFLVGAASGLEECAKRFSSGTDVEVCELTACHADVRSALHDLSSHDAEVQDCVRALTEHLGYVGRYQRRLDSQGGQAPTILNEERNEDVQTNCR